MAANCEGLKKSKKNHVCSNGKIFAQKFLVKYILSDKKIEFFRLWAL